jgi:mRNA-degrading endonuclease RelE of RelBE toxin-antitoxin system
MKSHTLPSFWEKYKRLDKSARERARKIFRLWAENPFHPSLHFKCVNAKEKIWSIRITLAIRAVGTMDNDTVTWYWIGDHDEYRKFFG